MAIQFQCTGCRQPIEIDDEWGGKQVACPYCRRTITAPETSTLDELGGVPVAQPATRPTPDSIPAFPDGPPPPIPPATAALGTSGSGTIAIVALVLTLCFVGCTLGYVGILRAHVDEFAAAIDPGTMETNPMGAWSEFLQQEYGGTPPGWMLALSALMFGGLAFWVAALVCSIIALRGSTRRGMGLGCLLTCAIWPVLSCCGSGIVTASAMDQPAGAGFVPVFFVEASGDPPAGTRNVVPQLPHFTRFPRTVSGTRSTARHVSLGH